MPERYASVHLDVDPSRTPAAEPREIPERPFDLLLIGDFSARSVRGEERATLADLRPIRIDRDDFDAVLARLEPRIALSLEPGAPAVELTFRDLDAFHPDALYQDAPLFSQLRELRQRAQRPEQLSGVAAELGSGPPSPPDVTAAGANSRSGSVLDRILQETASAPLPSAADVSLRTGDALRDVVHRLVRPHLVPGPDPRQAELVASIDAALAEGMRRILHHPEFQRVESLWRGAKLLVRRLETSSLLRVQLLDLSEAELTRALAKGGAGAEHLFGRTADADSSGVRPALILFLRALTGSKPDLRLLERLGDLAVGTGAPCIAAAATDLVELARSESSETWSSLRRRDSARFVGLSYPCFLLRETYGEDADECERFAFEELVGPPGDDEFLWGSPAYACGLLLAQSFAADGWRMSPGSHREIDQLPVPLIPAGGGPVVRAPVQIVLSEVETEELVDSGITPLTPVRDRGAIRVVRFQSMAYPLAALEGPWNHA